MPLSPQEAQVVEELAGLWARYLQVSARPETAFHSWTEPELEAALSEQLALFGDLSTQMASLVWETRLAIEAQVDRSARASERAERISRIAAAAALLLSLLISFRIVRSISKPLRVLTEGTQASAAGQFSYRLAETGNDELTRLASDFNTMTRRLNELDQMKRDFAAHVTHELKTPLASINETIRLLLEEIPGPLNGQQRRFLELNLESSRRLSSLIGNLLDLSRMEAGVMQYELERHDLAALIRSALEEFEAPVRERQVSIQAQLPDEPVLVDCDGQRVRQVVGNLVGNALKFSPSGGSIRVGLARATKFPPNLPDTWRRRIHRTTATDGYLLISVADSGPGIPPAEKDRIFEKFYQAKTSKRIAGQGAGLGLAISLAIVQAHGGAIWVEDAAGGGSVFSVLLTAGMVREEATLRRSSPI